MKVIEYEEAKAMGNAQRLIDAGIGDTPVIIKELLQVITKLEERVLALEAIIENRSV